MICYAVTESQEANWLVYNLSKCNYLCFFFKAIWLKANFSKNKIFVISSYWCFVLLRLYKLMLNWRCFSICFALTKKVSFREKEKFTCEDLKMNFNSIVYVTNLRSNLNLFLKVMDFKDSMWHIFKYQFSYTLNDHVR